MKWDGREQGSGIFEMNYLRILMLFFKPATLISMFTATATNIQKSKHLCYTSIMLPTKKELLIMNAEKKFIWKATNNKLILKEEQKTSYIPCKHYNQTI